MITSDGKFDNVCNRTVAPDMCIGCGVCVAVCPTKTLKMGWDLNGFLVPEDEGRCAAKCTHCLDVCPFLDQPKNEDELAGEIFGRELNHSPNVGYYSSCFAGHANDGYRERGASGGMASWFMATLIEKGMVDHVISVKSKADAQNLYQYALLSTPEEVRSGSKSAYYPVELSKVLQHVLSNDGRYAVVGLPCFIKALRLAVLRVPLLRRRIIIMAGLVCGQTKSRHFASYLVHQTGLAPEDAQEVIFRGKRQGMPAYNFEMRVRDIHGTCKTFPWEGRYSEAWLSGIFSPRACGLCDDTFAELADISFMDAWLPEYFADPKGGSLVVCRSALALSIVQQGIKENKTSLEPISVERVEMSQAGVTLWKRRDLPWRLWLAERRSLPFPKKRVLPERPPLWHLGRLRMREKLRQDSLAQWSDNVDLGPDHRNAAVRVIELKVRSYIQYLSIPRWLANVHRYPLWALSKLKRVVLRNTQ